MDDLTVERGEVLVMAIENNGPVAPFRTLNPNQWITRSDMLHWVQMQKFHDEHKDDPGHQCDLCPVRIVFNIDEANNL